MRKKIFVVFGTRPEAIKLVPVIQQLHAYEETFKTIVCISAQHRKMLDQVLDLFHITPQYDLNIMVKNQDLFDITVAALSGLKDVYQNESPDLVLVQGDTTTSFVAALSAYYCKIPIAHVEAGLRTHDKYSPFPEEKNRQLLSTLADLHFAPTETSKSNLLNEGIPAERIWVTGNTVIDTLIDISKRYEKQETKEYWMKYFRNSWNLDLGNTGKKIILVTGHRRENFGKGFQNICSALKTIAQSRKDIVIAYPIHLNPNVKKPVVTFLGGIPNIILLDPLEYEPFVFLMKHSYLILTDSGGIQEEGPALSKPILVMRDTSERPEGIEAGTAKLVGTNTQKIVQTTLEIITNKDRYDQMAKTVNPYGDGKAAQRIVRILSQLNSYSQHSC